MTVSSLRVLVPPASPAVPLDRLKRHLRLDHAFDDDEVALCLAAATDWAELFLARSLVTQTLVWSIGATALPQGGLWGNRVLQQALSAPPGSWSLAGMSAIDLPRSPVQAVTAIQVVLRDGTVRALVLGTDAYVDLVTEPARVSLRSAAGAFGAGVGGHTAITFRAGYGDTADSVPPSITIALCWLVAFLYENRGDAGGDMPETAKNLLWPHRLVTFGG